MKEFVKITKAMADRISLTEARLIAKENLRPSLDPKLNEDGYFVIYDNGSYEWITVEEFKNGGFLEYTEEGFR